MRLFLISHNHSRHMKLVFDHNFCVEMSNSCDFPSKKTSKFIVSGSTCFIRLKMHHLSLFHFPVWKMHPFYSHLLPNEKSNWKSLSVVPKIEYFNSLLEKASYLEILHKVAHYYPKFFLMKMHWKHSSSKSQICPEKKIICIILNRSFMPELSEKKAMKRI